MPTLCFALSDACTNHSDYTIDKRCYVTEEQKQKKPYNAVVAFLDNTNFIYCTGTIIEKENELFVYTAKHCLHNKNKHKISLQNGIKINAYKFETGNFYTKNKELINIDGDYAILKLKSDEKNIPYVKIAENHESDNARVTGYGILKIMSDKEIRYFKQQYITYLKGKFPDIIDASVEISKRNKDAVKWIKTRDFKSEFADVFKDKQLKVSVCTYSKTGKMSDCQGWHGDSGSGIFDVNGNIMGIVSSGAPYMDEDDYAKLVNSVNLQTMDKDTVLDFISDD